MLRDISFENGKQNKQTKYARDVEEKMEYLKWSARMKHFAVLLTLLHIELLSQHSALLAGGEIVCALHRKECEKRERIFAQKLSSINYFLSTLGNL